MTATEHYTIRDARPEDRAEWQPLWEGYLVFYKTNLPQEHTGSLWNRILDDADPIRCIVAEVDGEVIGIAQYFPHPDTWANAPACYLADLFVAETHRRAGIGRALIQELQRRCLENGWPRLYWLTMEDNATARILYDELTGGTDGEILYEIEIG